MTRISWTEHVKNEEFLRVIEPRTLIFGIGKKQLKLLLQIMNKEGLENTELTEH